MRRIAVLAVLLPLLMLVQAVPATAVVSCHHINATGAGQGAPPQAGDPPGLIRTIAQIRGGGLLQGTTEAAFQVTGSTPTGIAFAGEITFTTNRGDALGRPRRHARPDDRRLPGVGRCEWGHRQTRRRDRHAHPCGSAEPARPAAGSFTETVSGEICVDLGGNGEK